MTDSNPFGYNEYKNTFLSTKNLSNLSTKNLLVKKKKKKSANCFVDKINETKLAIRRGDASNRVETIEPPYSMMQYVESGIKIEYKNFPFTQYIYINIYNSNLQFLRQSSLCKHRLWYLHQRCRHNRYPYWWFPPARNAWSWDFAREPAPRYPSVQSNHEISKFCYIYIFFFSRKFYRIYLTRVLVLRVGTHLLRR